MQIFDTDAAAADLDSKGWHLIPNFLGRTDCLDLRAAYARDDLYRSTVTMQRHGFGKGEYRYYRYPLPPLVERLRRTCYPPLAKIANRWSDAMGHPTVYPADHEAFLAQCALAGQGRPTPLILRYGPGDYNCLHQDLYGERHFPL